MPRPIEPLSSRILRNIERNSSGCWEWTGRITRSGYGETSAMGKHLFAHRASYETFVGRIPQGMLVCHSCDNPRCVNPEHLWLGDQKANIADARAKRRLRGMTATHCRKGHEYTEANTYLKSGRVRNCRTCGREAVARYNRKRKERS